MYEYNRVYLILNRKYDICAWFFSLFMIIHANVNSNMWITQTSERKHWAMAINHGGQSLVSIVEWIPLGVECKSLQCKERLGVCSKTSNSRRSLRIVLTSCL